MNRVNRSVAIITPKQPYVDWANQLPDADFQVSLDDFREDCLAVLIPDFDTDDEATKYMNGLAEDIFEEELWAWCTEEAWWPKNRTAKLFWRWFHVSIHSEVIDLGEGPIEED